MGSAYAGAIASILVLALAAGLSDADDLPAPAPASRPAGVSSPSAACCVLRADTELRIELAEEVGSATRTRGETFVVRLLEPVPLEGGGTLPAGTPGVGQVVHADRSRGGGKPGELLLAARYLEAGSTRVPLKGFRIGGAGQDRTRAALATSMVAGPFALFMRGREVVVPVGTAATARVAHDTTLAPPSHAEVAPDAPSVLQEQNPTHSTHDGTKEN